MAGNGRTAPVSGQSPRRSVPATLRYLVENPAITLEIPRLRSRMPAVLLPRSHAQISSELHSLVVSAGPPAPLGPNRGGHFCRRHTPTRQTEHGVVEEPGKSTPRGEYTAKIVAS